jgi:hypothetical protein
MFLRRSAPILTFSLLLLLATLACRSSMFGHEEAAVQEAAAHEAVALDQSSTVASLPDAGNADENAPVATSFTDTNDAGDTIPATPSLIEPDDTSDEALTATSGAAEAGEPNSSAELEVADDLDEHDSFVLIDRTNPAYVLYFHLPREELAGIRALIDEPERSHMVVDLVGWQQFTEQYEQHTIVYTTRQDYPEVRVGEGIVALLERFPGAPFGLTWNGGIAYTRNDYNFTIASYEAYLKDPGAYNKRERAGDPVHPHNHLIPLLGEGRR